MRPNRHGCAIYEVVSDGGMKMNKRYFLIVPISLTFVACGGAEQMSALECAKDTGPEPPCAGDPKNPEVTINTNTWVFTPRCIKANKKEKIVFRLTPAADNPLGSTAIQPKDLKDTWLTGVNSPDEMKIEYAGELETETAGAGA